MALLKRLITEPLVHFLLLGGLLFAVFSLRADRGRPAGDAIVVSEGKIAHLAALFARTWQRPPTRSELEGLVADTIREEAAYREALALGLDRDDTIVRRRLRQKLEFMAEDLADQIEPGTETLAAYLAAHPEDFRVAPRLTFHQVYLNPEAHGDSLEADAADLRSFLNAEPDVAAHEFGDGSLLEHVLRDITPRQVANLFGPGFAERIVTIEPGRWEGPIASAHGVHLVFVDRRTESYLPELEAVRAKVRREWENARREALLEQYYEGLLGKYAVTIEWPEAEGAQ
jgi:hypothetical protein